MATDPGFPGFPWVSSSELGDPPLVCKDSGYWAVKDPHCPAQTKRWPGCPEHTLGDGRGWWIFTGALHSPVAPRCAGVSAQQADERQQHETHPTVGSGRCAGPEAARSRCQVGGRGLSNPLCSRPSRHAPEMLFPLSGRSQDLSERWLFTSRHQLWLQPCCSCCCSSLAFPFHPVAAVSFCLDLFTKLLPQVAEPS